MTFAHNLIGNLTPNGVLSNFLLSHDVPAALQRAVDAIVELAPHDAGTALKMAHEALAAAPAAAGEAATSIAASLQDHALRACTQLPGGRELLQLLRHHAGDGAQADRLRDALQFLADAPAAGAGTLAQMAAQARPVRAASTAPGESSSQAAGEPQVTSAFEQEFAAKATNKEEFDAFMQQVFGDSYDKDLAEQYRQQALAGDFSFLPEVQYVDAEVLGGANGAYNAEEGVVYINKDLDPATAAQTFVEEAGHHLDAQLNTSDTQGDEGEMFRRVLAGEQLTSQQVAEIRNENDMGTITVDGKEVQVEFWNPFKAVADAAKAVGNAVVDGAKAVGNAVVDGAKAVGNAVVDGAKAVGNAVVDGAKAVGNVVVAGVKATAGVISAGAQALGNIAVGFGQAAIDAASDVAKGVFNGIKAVGSGIWDAAKDVGLGLWEATGGFVSNLLKGRIGEAFGSVVRGLDRAIFQSTERFWLGMMEGAQQVTNGITDALGPLGKPLRWVTDRAFDIGRTALDTAFTMGRGAFRLIPDIAVGFVSDMERAVKLAAAGNWGAAAEQFGMAFVNIPKRSIGHVVDMSMVFLQGAASIGQTAIGLEPPARKLTGAEIQYLKTIYGDSIDYGLIRIKPGGPLNNAMAAHTVGNTIYLPASDFNPDGSLTAQGLVTLSHEAGHVWQNQNGGPDYISDALGANLWAQISTGNRNNAYNWRAALANGETFETMNDEQRAQAMEDVGAALRDDGRITTGDSDVFGFGGNYSRAEVAFLRALSADIKRGEGAG